MSDSSYLGRNIARVVFCVVFFFAFGLLITWIYPGRDAEAAAGWGVVAGIVMGVVIRGGEGE